MRLINRLEQVSGIDISREKLVLGGDNADVLKNM